MAAIFPPDEAREGLLANRRSVQGGHDNWNRPLPGFCCVRLLWQNLLPSGHSRRPGSAPCDFVCSAKADPRLSHRPPTRCKYSSHRGLHDSRKAIKPRRFLARRSQAGEPILCATAVPNPAPPDPFGAVSEPESGHQKDKSAGHSFRPFRVARPHRQVQESRRLTAPPAGSPRCRPKALPG